jgi:hypothetical protein
MRVLHLKNGINRYFKERFYAIPAATATAACESTDGTITPSL